MATIDLTATDYFNLPAGFFAQSSSQNFQLDAVNVQAEDGDTPCENMIFGRTEFSTEYRVCDSVTDVISSLGTVLSQFGEVRNSKIITGVTVTFTAGEFPTVSITGIEYDEAQPVAIGNADVSVGLPSGASFGVPTMPGVVLGASAEPTSLTLTWSHNHIVARNNQGEHFASENITFRGEASAEFVGIPSTLEPFTGWTTDSTDLSDSNSDFDTSAVNAHRFYDRA